MISTGGPVAAAWWFLAAAFVAAVAFVIAGAVGVVRAALPLRGRLDAYADLPMLRAVEQTRVRLEDTQTKIEQLNALIERSKAALDTIQISLARLVATVAGVRQAGVAALGLLKWITAFLGLAPTRR